MREALGLLTRDGLAVHTVHRSVTVRQFEPDEVRDVFEVRRLFEEAVAERAGSLTDQETAALILRDHEPRSGGPWIGKTRELLDLLRDGDSRGYRETIRTYIAAACDDALAGPRGSAV